MAYNNFTVSEVNFNETQNTDLGESGVKRLTITPSVGYQVLASDFSLTDPIPSIIDPSSAVFQQAGNLIHLDLSFNPGSIMPGNDIDVPICLSGFARSAPYSVEGVVNVVEQNTNSDSAQYSYSDVGNFTESKVVWNKTIQANSGFYFYQAPIAAINTGTPSDYDIVTTETRNIYNELVAVTYEISYTFPANNVSGDIINVQAFAIPSVGSTTYINAFNVSGIGSINQPPIPSNGDTRELNLFGDPSAIYSVSLFDTDGVETVLADNQTMPSNGRDSIFGITFPEASENKGPFELVVSGNINPNIANVENDLVITFTQIENVTFTISATSSNPQYNVSGSPAVFTALKNYTYQPDELNSFPYHFVVTKANGSGLVKTNDVLASSFTPAIPDSAYPDTLYSLANPQTLNSTNELSVMITGMIVIQETKEDSITHSVDVSNFVESSDGVEVMINASPEVNPGEGGQPIAYPSIEDACAAAGTNGNFTVYTGAGLNAPERGMDLYTDPQLQNLWDGGDLIYKIIRYNGFGVNYASSVDATGIVGELAFADCFASQLS